MNICYNIYKNSKHIGEHTKDLKGSIKYIGPDLLFSAGPRLVFPVGPDLPFPAEPDSLFTLVRGWPFKG